MATRWSPPPRVGAPLPGPPVRVRQRPQSPLRRLGSFAGRWTIPIVGGVTPVALIMVNAAVWINDHVTELAVWIAIAAFLSGMALNSWWCLKVHRALRRRFPRWAIFDPSREELLLVLGMLGVTVVTFLLALGCYFGLKDTKHLPNAYTLWWGLLQIIVPIIAKVFFDRDEGRTSSVGGASGASGAGTLSAPPGVPPPRGRVVPPPPSGSGGYTPPYLPPS